MRTQPAMSHKAIYSFETEDFEQWQLSTLNANAEADGDEYDSLFNEESLADNVIEFLGEVATD